MQIKESIITISDILNLCLENRLTFAAYRLPGQTDITLVIQDNQELCELKDITELTKRKGFLIAPFYIGRGEKTFLIRPDIVIKNEPGKGQVEKVRTIASSYINGLEQIVPAETTEDVFLDQVGNTIDAIKRGEFKKVVISRVKIINGEYTTKLSRIFKILSESYMHSFIYLFRIKGHCWIGATPEPFICSMGDELTTVSLAGTRQYNEKNLEIMNWNNKELKEQEYVTNYIEDILKQFQIKDFIRKGPYTKKAGHLLHLRTDFAFSVQLLGQNLYSFIAALHPTSAVCGMPMEKVREFILSTEKHNREYYAGLVGPVGIDDHLQLFVNLRCMKVFTHQLALFIGGGITSDSDPQEEWEETEIKTDTLLSVVQQVN
jgi:isochorismate synthase